MPLHSLQLTSVYDIEDVTILQLMQEFQALLQQPNNPEALDIETKKLMIIQAFEQTILHKLPATYALQAAIPRSNHSALDPTLKILLYYFLLLFGLFESIAGSYIFGFALFSMIPAISNPMVVIASIIFTVLSSILFYGFEVTFLKDALGIPYTSTVWSQLIDVKAQQLETTIHINQLLATMHMQRIDAATYNEYLDLIALLNQDLRSKYEKMGAYPESLLKSVLKVSIIAFGALSSIAGSSFMANSLLALIAPALLGTPIGWAIIFLTILSGLGFYYAMNVTSMVRLVNPSFDHYQSLKDELKLFVEVYHDDLSQIKLIKEGFIRKNSAFLFFETSQVDASVAPSVYKQEHSSNYRKDEFR